MDTEIEVRKMECKEIRVDVRTASIKESTEGQRQTKILFQINHTMPFTDRSWSYDTSGSMYRKTRNCGSWICSDKGCTGLCSSSWKSGKSNKNA